LSQIQNRSGDRKAAVEMAFGASQGNRAQVKELFRQLQRVRAVKAEPAEPERVVTLCRQTADDLQEHPIRNAREAARRAEALGGEDDPAEARKRQRGQNLSHGRGF
jgi:DNA-binding GntR family transcriptional regulator